MYNVDTLVSALYSLGVTSTWACEDSHNLTTLELQAVCDNASQEITLDALLTALQEISAAEPLRLLREERNRLLTETDWWVLPDRTPAQEQLDYRQALRDITDIYSSLEDVVWPVKPTE